MHGRNILEEGGKRGEEEKRGEKGGISCDGTGVVVPELHRLSQCQGLALVLVLALARLLALVLLLFQWQQQ